MKIDKVSIPEKLNSFNDYWNPRIVGELNEQLVKVVKFKGEFTWHKHDYEDEMFQVIHGKFIMEFRDKVVELKENEFIIVPKGVEHKPVAKEEVSVMLFEPKSILNTGDKKNEFTKEYLDKI